MIFKEVKMCKTNGQCPLDINMVKWGFYDIVESEACSFKKNFNDYLNEV